MKNTLCVLLCCLLGEVVRADELLRIISLPSVHTLVMERVMREVYRRAGIGVVMEMQPFARAEFETGDEKQDGQLGRSKEYGELHPEIIRVEPPFYTVLHGIVGT